MHLLVADDNEINLRVACAYLKALGVEENCISVARNGAEAIDKCRSARFDLIFMDIQMPEVDGVEATRRILKEHVDKPPLVVALTANVSDKCEQEYLSAGMKKVLHKPLSKQAMQNALQLIENIGRD